MSASRLSDHVWHSVFSYRQHRLCLFKWMWERWGRLRVENRACNGAKLIFLRMVAPFEDWPLYIMKKNDSSVIINHSSCIHCKYDTSRIVILRWDDHLNILCITDSCTCIFLLLFYLPHMFLFDKCANILFAATFQGSYTLS